MKETIKISKLIVFAIIFGLILISCNRKYYTALHNWNLSAIYNPHKSSIHPSYKVYHNSANTSLLFVKVYTNELMFQPSGVDGNPVGSFEIEYTLLDNSPEEKQIVDSGTFNYQIPQNTDQRFFITQVPFKAELDKSYTLKIIMRDNQRKTFNMSFVEVEKMREIGQQFYNITNYDGSPIFRNVIIGKGLFKVNHFNPPGNKLYISYYKNNTPTPKPTFAVSNLQNLYVKPDSVYITDYSPNKALALANEGLYFIQFDTNYPEGVSLVRFSDGFPKVTQQEELIEPLSYITSEGEFKTIKEQPYPKLAADNFWLKAGNGPARGREMLRVYYNRVYFANYYFTSTKPGWKTDRGMVYIVYGPPHNLKKNASSEIWYYYRKGSGESIKFKFNHDPAKYHINEYALERSDNYTWNWREAVYSWSNGKIFLLD